MLRSKSVDRGSFPFRYVGDLQGYIYNATQQPNPLLLFFRHSTFDIQNLTFDV